MVGSAGDQPYSSVHMRRPVVRIVECDKLLNQLCVASPPSYDYVTQELMQPTVKLIRYIRIQGISCQ